MFTYSDYEKSAALIRSRLSGFEPEALVILGSGLGALADGAEDAIALPYGDIEGFPVSTAPGHKGRFVAGKVGGRRVLMMQGRFHMYEGYTAEEVAYPVRVASLLGAGTLVATNAAGSVNPALPEGSLMAISDFMCFAPADPLIGQNIPEFGTRFPDMSRAFDREYTKHFIDIAASHGELIHEGVYFEMTGPRYETPAEIRAIRTLGADAVGMSTVQEVIAAHHAGMRTLGVSMLANMAAGMRDEPFTEGEVIAAAERAGARFRLYITEFLSRMD